MSNTEKSSSPIKLSVYVDGFNLYYGLKEAKMQRFYWLDLHKFAASFLRDNQVLASVKYFTARISRPDDKRIRQNTFLEAITASGGVEIFEGKFLSKAAVCRACGQRWQDYEEKMTDVNIATEMLMDGIAGRFDRAILVSADSDLVPPVMALRGPIIQREVIVALPPNRTSVDLKRAASGFFQINSSRLARCQFPEEIIKPDGFVLSRPATWK